MNNILQLKGSFQYKSNPSRPGPPKLPANQFITASHLEILSGQLSQILDFWTANPEINGALVSIHYTRIIPKSYRVKYLFSENSHDPSESVRGVRFIEEADENGKMIKKHVFTHYLSLATIQKTIRQLSDAASDMRTFYNGKVDSELTDKIGKNTLRHQGRMPKTSFLRILCDCFSIESFEIDTAIQNNNKDQIITIYRTDVDAKQLLLKYGIQLSYKNMIDDTTFALSAEDAQVLYQQAPYLISMSVSDFSQIPKDDYLNFDDELFGISIPSPSNEPIVGVIDTQFNQDVYFHEWVECHNMLNDPELKSFLNRDSDRQFVSADYKHGTAVSHIIVDGPTGNPKLDDGCGRFRVRHFGVATSQGFKVSFVIKTIRKIIETNRDIKVWNLSLGSPLEINPNFISPEAAELDRLQNEFDIIFVVAGTNKPLNYDDQDMKIGAPADSLNSVVVNSVGFNKQPAPYTRTGPVLSFFNKPDLSYYGGSEYTSEEGISVCYGPFGEDFVAGTSFAAPWITRKLAFLIHILGLSREIAKALLIDSAVRWNSPNEVSSHTGYGIVPVHIQDVVESPEDEIRFFLQGKANQFETYTYNLPVPVVNDQYPYFARATLVYFPWCDRNQGVDYTTTEMDLHFGRVYPRNDGKYAIKTINNNHQSTDRKIEIWEEDARNHYRKWDNIKHIREPVKKRSRPKKRYPDSLWGLSIKTKERLSKRKEPLQFGVVITLKAMDGENRVEEFIQQCWARGWIVNQINVENSIDIYNTAEEEIHFES